MRTLISLSLLLTSCGAPEPETKTESVPLISTATPIPAETDVKIRYRQDGDKTSRILSDGSELEPCDLSHAGERVYIESESRYLQCTDDTWTEVTPAAYSAPAPTPTPIPSPTPTLKPSSKNQWEDPITYQSWIIATTAAEYPLALKACSGDFHLPTRDDVLVAALHGIAGVSLEFGGQSEVWTSDLDLDTPSERAWTVQLEPALELSAPMSEAHGVLCLKSVNLQ